MRIFLVLSLIFSIYSSAVYADTFIAKDGTTLAGEVIAGEMSIHHAGEQDNYLMEDIFYIGPEKLILENGNVLNYDKIEGSISVDSNMGNMVISSDVLGRYIKQEKVADNKEDNFPLETVATHTISLVFAGKYKQAIKSANELYSKASGENKKYWLTVSKVLSAFARLFIGEYEQARVDLKGNLDILTAMFATDVIDKDMYSLLQSKAFLTMARIMALKGDFESAESYYQKVNELQLLREQSQPEWTAYRFLADDYKRMGDYARALELLMEGLQKARGSREEALFLNRIAQIYFMQAKIQKALDFFSEEEQVRIKNGDSVRVKEGIDSQGRGYLQGNIFSYQIMKKWLASQDDLIFTYSSFIKAADLAKNVFETTMMFWSRAKLYEAAGKIKEAKEDYEAAIASIESLRFNNAALNRRTDFFVQYALVYHDYARLLVNNNNYTKALSILEQSRSKFLKEMMKSRESVEWARIDKNLIESERDLEDSISRLYNELLMTKELLTLTESERRKKLEDLARNLKDKEKDLKKIRDRIVNQNVDYGYLKFQHSSLDINKFQQSVLKDEQALLAYSVGEDDVLIFTVTKQLIHADIVKMSEDSLKKSVVSIRKTFLNEESVFDETNFLSSSIQLRKKIFDPVKEKLRQKTNLLIMPDSYLYYLPFGTLVEETNDSSGVWSFLAEKYEFAVIPSCQIYAKLQKKESKNSELVAFADPVYETIKTNGTLNWPRLPNTATEAMAINNAFNGKAKLYLRENATEFNAKSKKLSSAKYIHFATHGYLDEKNSMHSALVLSQNSDKNDGFLRVYEILGMNLNAEIVTLAACETGLGKFKRGEGLLSLARSFIYAGASSVLVSLWSVDDYSTSVFMENFYAGLVKHGFSKSKALYYARNSMLKRNTKEKNDFNSRGIKIIKNKDVNKSYRNPYYWSPFVLVGDSN